MAKKSSRRISRKSEPSRVISPVLGCTPKRLPRAKLLESAAHACKVNPQNFAPVHRLSGIMPGFAPNKERLAVVTAKYWGVQGVRLSVGFLDNPSQALRRMILENMNAWGRTANVKFMETSSASSARVRIARLGGPDGGYWSYVGTDIDLITPGEPTMNLEGFTENTDESEFRRVVRHEAGHTLGFPHEHMRRELVARIDEEKAIEYFGRTQGWSPAEVRQQVLTPIEDGSILGTPDPDPFSIMCYQIGGEITVDGQPIIGGSDIDEEDRQFAARIYPKPAEAPVAEPETGTDITGGGGRISEGSKDLLADYVAIQRLQAENLAALLASPVSGRAPLRAAGPAAGGLPSDIPISTPLTRAQVFQYLKSLISDHFNRSIGSFDAYTQLVAAEGNPVPITSSSQQMEYFTYQRVSSFFHCQPRIVYGDNFEGNLVGELSSAIYENRSAQ